MAIPDYQTCMLPLLRFASDGKEHQMKDAAQAIAAEFNLSDTELSEFLPSGQQPIFINRIAWARTYLKKAGLLLSPRRGYFQISSRGRAVLDEQPREINVKYLERFPEFLEFRTRKDNAADTPDTTEDTASPPNQTPHEVLEVAYEQLRSELSDEILQALKSSDPALFENIVVALLVKMGYGGSRQDAGKAIGRSGDEGIDGIIKEDHLGLDTAIPGD